MALVGNFPRFYYGEDDWDVYHTQFEFYLRENHIPESKWRDALLVSIATSIYMVLRDKCHPELPTDKTYDELIAFLKNHYVFRKPVFRERTNFYNARQFDDETIDEWHLRIATLAVDCNFGQRINSVLLDRFISGLRSQRIRDRLCEEDEHLVLHRALKIALNEECSLKSVSV